MWSPIRQLVEAGVLVRGGAALVRGDDESKEDFDARVADALVASSAALYQYTAGVVTKTTKISLRSRALTLARQALLNHRKQTTPRATTVAVGGLDPGKAGVQARKSQEQRERQLWPRLYRQALILVGFTGDDITSEVEKAPSYTDGTAGLTEASEQATREEADRR